MVADAAEGAALEYLSRGWSVVPIRSRGKRPLIAWQGYQQSPPTAAQVEQWYARWPSANVGIVTGAVSGLIVIDIDPAHDGNASLMALEAQHGRLPETVEAVSGGGGRHLYFAHPGEAVHNRVGLCPGIDVRGDGGVIVAPPSVHRCGKSYRWKSGRAPSDIACARLPGWLLSTLGVHSGRPSSYWRELVARGVARGSRNTTIASLTGHLLRFGLDDEVITELLLCWNRVRCRPPLADAEVHQTIESIMRTHRRHAHDDRA